MLIDSHCHLHMLDLTPYQGDLAAYIAYSQQQGLETLLTVAIDVDSSEKAIAIAEQYPQVYASVGVHPSDTKEPDIDWTKLEKLAKHPKVIAIGETGLDFYYHSEHFAQQEESFRRHIQLALQVKKPLIIHSRSAPKETIDILQEESAASVRGVMHCFTESWEMAEQSMELGFYISISGIVTFKNAQAVAEVAAKMPLERLLIETDAPYLAPIPYRGKTNYPHYVRYVAEKIAELKQIPVEQVIAQTNKNFKELFLL